MRFKKIISLLTVAASVVLLMNSCKKNLSNTTAWEYNNPKNGGFEVVPYEEQETGPGLVLIEGGTFVMGRTEQDVLYDWDNIPRRITVSSFYMDQTEIRNIDYLEFLYWTKRVFGIDYPEVLQKRLPDTLVWRERLAYNEPLVDYYLRHPSYRDYPVVGVSWVQAADYCNWRTDRVNEYILMREGILKMDPNQQNEENFNTDAYLAGQYEGMVKNDLYDMDPNGSGTRKVRMEDGILLPKYRLPTEAEWEFAALGLIGNTIYERVIERRIYPWNGHISRNDRTNNLGDFVANFKRGRGDNMGVAGNLNDAADITAPVYAYWPNDYGLYCMAGNVSEWVMDVYRPLSFEDFSDFRSFRGNVYQTQVKDADGVLEDKDSLGRIIMRDVTVEESKDRRNYRQADNRNFIDGDVTSSLVTTDDWSNMEDTEGTVMYDYGFNSMINDKARVYKGGSWRDRQYWLSPGNRKYLDENLSTDFIGFRCAMTRVGSPVGNY
ncbi:MAG: SUMF1/EgtB/PvdO family nonheme iron enzyme [Bacteroidales bacterium]|jgi:gliding motility-associated lipoprotein GldJ|nr:SUMF1/EgtB/PvdO family nonheme iron enzyme [Bacteroidales bacterium]